MIFQGGNHYNCNFFGHIEVLDVYLIIYGWWGQPFQWTEPVHV